MRTFSSFSPMPIILVWMLCIQLSAQKPAFEQRVMDKFKIRQTAADTLKTRPTPAVTRATETIYDRIRIMLKVNDPDYYIGFPTSNNLRTLPPNHALRPQEGAHGYILELRLAQRFPIIEPGYSRSDAWIRAKMFTFNYDFQYRVARRPEDSDDSPGLPLNTKFGITLVEYVFPLTLRKSGYFKSKKSDAVNPTFSTDKLGSGICDKNNLAILVPRLDFMHYSNGQREVAIYVPADGSPSIRNNYANGNFSTNYLLAQIDLSVLNASGKLYNLNAGYRVDFGIAQLLSFEPRQKNRYGSQRLVEGITFRAKPRVAYKVRDAHYDRERYIYQEQKKTMTEVEQAKLTKPKKEMHSLIEWYMRLQLEHIIKGTDDLDIYKTGVTAQVGANFFNNKVFGLMLQGHYGRDYLNIRYDMPVCNFLIAATFQVNSYAASGNSKLHAFEEWSKQAARK